MTPTPDQDPVGDKTTPVSLADIARATGFGRSTVSLALRGHPRIPEPTRALILKAAEDLGYRFDHSVSRAMSAVRRAHRRGPTPIAWLNTRSSPDVWRKLPWLREIRDGAFAQATEVGYMIDEFWLLEPALTPERLHQILKSRGIRSLLLTGVAPQSRALPYAGEFPWNEFSVVAIGSDPPNPPIHRVQPHFVYNTRQLVGHVARAGCRRLSMIEFGEVDTEAWFEREAAFLRASQLETGRLGKIVRLDLPRPEVDGTIGPADRFVRHLECFRPDAILAGSCLVATWLRRLGIRVPQDIGLVTTDAFGQPPLEDSEGYSERQFLERIATHTDPAIRRSGLPNTAFWSGIDQRSGRIGAEAINLLASLEATNQFGIPPVAKTVLVRGAWHPGDTLRDRNTAASAASGNKC